MDASSVLGSWVVLETVKNKNLLILSGLSNEVYAV